MKEQNFKNHARVVPLFHYVASALIAFAFINAAIVFFKSINAHNKRLDSFAYLCLIVGVSLVFWFARSFALKAQDRAIRAEVNFRYYIATGMVLDSRLTMSQIIALRFAGNDEFVLLAKKAIEENLTAKQIKMSITNWKPDFDRA